MVSKAEDSDEGEVGGEAKRLQHIAVLVAEGLELPAAEKNTECFTHTQNLHYFAINTGVARD